MTTVGARNLWRQMGQTSQINAYGILLNKFKRTIGVAAVCANARMKLRILSTLVGRRDDAQYNRASREEPRFREAEWENYLRPPWPSGIPPRIRALHLEMQALPLGASTTPPHIAVHNIK